MSTYWTERAKTGKSRCSYGSCATLIAKGEIRIGRTYRSHPSRFWLKTDWYHVDCFVMMEKEFIERMVKQAREMANIMETKGGVYD